MKMKTHLVAPIVILSLLGGTSVAFAMGGKDRGHSKMHSMHQMLDLTKADSNGDGALSKQEIETYAKQQFMSHDSDNDGVLSATELVSAHLNRLQQRAEKMQERMVSKLDTDNDGAISFEELQAGQGDRLSKMFDRLDRNDDGVLSQEEIAKFKSKGDKKRKGLDQTNNAASSDEQ